MDAGGLAQMSYNGYPSNGALGVPGSGFASRGKDTNIKRLSVALPSELGSNNGNQSDPNPTPRTSRSHLLAGLRTQPKMPAVPASAPYNQSQHRFGLEASKYADANYNPYAQGVPQTATGSSFSGRSNQQYNGNAGRQMYSFPEQVLAPQAMEYGGEDDQMSQQLRMAEMYLAQRQQHLQQQLMELQLAAAANQLQGLNLSSNQYQQYPNTPMSPEMGVYNQQLQNGMSPVTQEVPGQPGLYLVYNPMTGQHSYAVDPSVQQRARVASSPPLPASGFKASSPDSEVPTPSFRAQISPPPQTSGSSPFAPHSLTPPKKSPSPPADVQPLPPPSANAFRRGVGMHKKAASLASNNTFTSSLPSVTDGAKSSSVRPSGFPPTPTTGTFGPGQARAGEHPTLRAGLERNGITRGSNGSRTPASETEISFSLSEDDGSDSVQSGGSSRKQSIGSLRAAANGAIGSEMKERSRERNSQGSVEGLWAANSVSSDEGTNVGGKLVEVKAEQPQLRGKAPPQDRRKMPMLVLTSAEKRKSSMF
ncbi:hypothetical protein BJ546DRAFT_947466 [Cryomyces antarcticus]